jgi:hypothetical protein
LRPLVVFQGNVSVAICDKKKDWCNHIGDDHHHNGTHYYPEGWLVEKNMQITKKNERKMSWTSLKRHRKENKLVYGPELPPKFLTTQGLIIRGIIFLTAIFGICYLLWKEFAGK